jgi:peptidoglycan biosynthesis protein MviN/MurJ (putative lipid II flippase)
VVNPISPAEKNINMPKNPNLKCMYKDITKEKFIVITVLTALLLIFSFLAGLAYGYLLKPRFGERYANIFFMVSFTIIFFSLIYIYHIWIGKIQGRED